MLLNKNKEKFAHKINPCDRFIIISNVHLGGKNALFVAKKVRCIAGNQKIKRGQK